MQLWLQYGTIAPNYQEVTMSSPRISARVPEKTRDLVHEAAEVIGVSVNDFIAIATLHEARKVLEQERTVMVAQNYSSAFFAAMDNPPKPNKALLAAAKRH